MKSRATAWSMMLAIGGWCAACNSIEAIDIELVPSPELSTPADLAKQARVIRLIVDHPDGLYGPGEEGEHGTAHVIDIDSDGALELIADISVPERRLPVIRLERGGLPDLPLDIRLQGFVDEPLAEGSGLPSGLVAHWQFDEGHGEFVGDSSGNEHHGQVQNDLAWTTGKLDAALSFDGVIDRVRIFSAGDLNDMRAFTITAWIRLRTYGGVIVRKSSLPPARFNFFITAEGVLGLFAGFTPDKGHWRSDAPLSLDVWHHIAVTYEHEDVANEPQFYVDGSQTETVVGTSPSDSAADDDENTYIGANHELSWLFSGVIDSVRIYDRILTSSEIETLHAFEGVTRPHIVAAGGKKGVRFAAGQVVDVSVPFNLTPLGLPPRVMAVAPDQDDSFVDCNPGGVVVFFSKAISEAGLDAGDCVYVTSNGSKTLLPSPIVYGRHLQVAFPDGFGVGQELTPYELVVCTDVEDFHGHNLDDDPLERDSQPFTSTFVVGEQICWSTQWCSEDLEYPVCPGNGRFRCDHEYLCVPHSCERLSCEPGYLCDPTTKTCEVDCRLYGTYGGCRAGKPWCDPDTGWCVRSR